MELCVMLRNSTSSTTEKEKKKKERKKGVLLIWMCRQPGFCLFFKFVIYFMRALTNFPTVKGDDNIGFHLDSPISWQIPRF